MTDLTSKLETWDSLQPELSVAVNAFPDRPKTDDTKAGVPYQNQYLESLSKLCQITDELGYVGLQNACLVYQETIQTQIEQAAQLDDQLYDILSAWPHLIKNYLQPPLREVDVEALIEHLQFPVWDAPLAPQDAELIRMLLLQEHQYAELGSAEEESHSSDVVAEAGVDKLAETTAIEDQQYPGCPAGRSEAVSERSLPTQVLELIEMFIEELSLMEEPLLKLFEIDPEQDPEGCQAAVELYDDYLERFGDATQAVGFLGLQQTVNMMRENLSRMALQGRVLNSLEQDLLAAWSGYAIAYLNDPYNDANCRNLVEWLQSADWSIPFPAEQAEALLILLQAPELADNDEELVEERPQLATAEDVRVDYLDDVNPDLLDALLQELPSQTETFSKAIQNLIGEGTLEDVQIAQRIAHTLKGAANTVGVTGIPTITHHVEDILVALAKQQRLPSHELALVLMNAADCLEAMGECLCGIGDPPEISQAQEVLQEILDWANRIDREGLSGQADQIPAAISEKPDPGPQQDGSANQAVTESSQQKQSTTSRSQVPMGLVDDLLRLGGENIILSGQVQEQVRRVDQRMQSMQSEFERLQRLGGELERLIDIRDLNTDRIQLDENSEFDPLEMDQYSELHTTSRMLVEAATDARQIGAMVDEQLQGLVKMLLTQEHLNREIQERVLSARMVPIQTVIPRLQRSVRQTCRLTGKQVELHISGTETLMDSVVLNDLIDPLMHVLRNAVDHGIEAPSMRTNAGKPENGNIWLDFLREGNNILVSCRDDGAGIDFSAVRQAAVSQGLLEPDQVVAEEELKNMLLMPNFTTRSGVTQTSGRGVGLDVVYSHVVSQGGSLYLKSQTGEGTTTELRLPLSLISTHALVVRAQDQVMAVADRGIVQILHATDGTPRELGDQQVFWVDEQIYPLKRLDEILQLPPDRRSKQRAPMPVLLVNTRSGVSAVQVQEILAGTDLVIKEFSPYVPRRPGIVGATILGDGAVTPVLDLPELMSSTHKPVPQPLDEITDETEQVKLTQPMVLVADDSLSARKALIQVMQDAGYEVYAARDGMEAVQVVEANRPDIVLADMEMPRMNGLELTAHLRARPETVDLPVIMITSRSSVKHRRQAEAAGVNVYLSKPFLDDELLDHVAALRDQA